MLLIEYIEQHYGKQRGNKTRFLRDNEEILPQELSRWLKAELKINIDTGEIYKPTSKSIAINRQAIVETSGHSVYSIWFRRFRAWAKDLETQNGRHGG